MRTSLLAMLSLLFVFGCLAIAIAEDNSTNQTESNQTIIDQNLTNSTNQTQTNQTNLNETGSNSTSNYTGNWSSKCEAVNHRVEGKIKNFEEGRIMHITSFGNIIGRINKVNERAKANGLNTIDLDSDLILLNESLTKLKADYALFIDKLKNTRNFTCGHSEGQFKAALDEAKAQLRVVRGDVEDIKELIKNTIKDDIKNLRKENNAARVGAIKDRINESKNSINKSLQERKDAIQDRIAKLQNRTGDNNDDDNETDDDKEDTDSDENETDDNDANETEDDD